MNIFLAIFALTVCIYSKEPEPITLELCNQESIEDVQNLVQSVTGTDPDDQIMVFGPKRFFQHPEVKKPMSPPRNYFSATSPKELEDLLFIVRTLGFKPLTKIYREKHCLEKAGDRIDHLHPLKFLLGIFTNEEMIAAVHNIRNRSWVWGEFSKNLKDTLKEESEKNNITSAQIQDFAAQLGLNPNLFEQSIQYRQWDALIDTLLTHIKRNQDSGKYDL